MKDLNLIIRIAPFVFIQLLGCKAADPNVTPSPMDAARLVDMAMPFDIEHTPLARTGEPCTGNSNCEKSAAGTMTAAQCLKSRMGASGSYPYPGGYCTSPCRPTQSDPATGINLDCPSDSATCELVSQTAGRCVKLCMVADTDCRAAEGYVCENNTPFAASCTPKAPDWCDPKMPVNCNKGDAGVGELCVSFSPDNSAGQCKQLCDVFMQGCPMPMQGTNGCLANPTTGDATCINTNPGMEGDLCRFLNDCVAGLACHTENNMRFCRHYCRAGGANDVPCTVMNQKCNDLSTSVKKAKIGICSP